MFPDCHIDMLHLGNSREKFIKWALRFDAISLPLTSRRF